ncbi:hypothetical protein LNQ81_06730 [Myroides sp. M-43]|uniref:hypothetical protein n=1 Tax=Myroides oncorhynchi TaxID=2893756 RepID=UPI001E34F22C|nr:hypothetical protein [Myroides oncorhynchi]MCC9042388.1 hypothetical protein [Myroides oncorhynchi]
MKHLILILIGSFFLCANNLCAQEKEETIVSKLQPEEDIKASAEKEEKTSKDKKKKKKSNPTLPPNNSTAFLQHLGGEEFTRDNIAKHYSDEFFYDWTISAGLSTMGLTIEALTPINKSLKFRAGIDLFYYNSKHYEVGIDDPNGDLSKIFEYKPNLAIKGKTHIIHAHALVDYYPVTDGLFFLSGGFYIGENKTNLDGYLINHQGERAVPVNGWPEHIDFQGNQIKITDGSNVKANVTLGSIIKTYLGIGMGRVVTNKKWGISVEMGMMYQGDYTIKQDGSKIVYNLDNSFEYNEKAEKWLNRIKWWPKLSVQVRYRLF